MIEPSVTAIERLHTSTDTDTSHALASSTSATSTIGDEIQGWCLSRNMLLISNKIRSMFSSNNASTVSYSMMILTCTV